MLRGAWPLLVRLGVVCQGELRTQRGRSAGASHQSARMVNRLEPISEYPNLKPSGTPARPFVAHPSSLLAKLQDAQDVTVRPRTREEVWNSPATTGMLPLCCRRLSHSMLLEVRRAFVAERGVYPRAVVEAVSTL